MTLLGLLAGALATTRLVKGQATMNTQVYAGCACWSVGVTHTRTLGWDVAILEGFVDVHDVLVKLAPTHQQLCHELPR